MTSRLGSSSNASQTMVAEGLADELCESNEKLRQPGGADAGEVNLMNPLIQASCSAPHIIVRPGRSCHGQAVSVSSAVPRSPATSAASSFFVTLMLPDWCRCR
jgi:hypothetical protein